MKRFQASEIDVQSMSQINGGAINVTMKDDATIIITSAKKAMVQEKDTTIEMSGTLTVEK